MEDPKRQAWMYVGAGVVAIVAAIWFLTTDKGTTGDFSLLDWAILAMGIVALYRGGRMFLALRRGEEPPADPGTSTMFRRKSGPDDQPKA